MTYSIRLVSVNNLSVFRVTQIETCVTRIQHYLNEMYKLHFDLYKNDILL